MAPSIIKDDLTPEPWPNFTDNQVSFLEKMFPARCLKTNEMVEDHLRYAGKVDLVQLLRAHVIGNPSALDMTDDEEEALDAMAIMEMGATE